MKKCEGGLFSKGHYRPGYRHPLSYLPCRTVQAHSQLYSYVLYAATVGAWVVLVVRFLAVAP